MISSGWLQVSLSRLHGIVASVKSVMLACVDVPILTQVVRTVPAIWRDSAKGMMRKAAFGESKMQGT